MLQEVPAEVLHYGATGLRGADADRADPTGATWSAKRPRAHLKVDAQPLGF